MKKYYKSHKIVILTAIVCLSLIFLSACGADQMDFAEDSMMVRGLEPQNHYDMESPEMARSENYYGKSTYPEQGTSDIRYIIQSGSMNITVKDTRLTVNTIRNLAVQLSGTISNLSLYEIREGQFSADITIRIPADKFDRAIEELNALGKVNYISTDEHEVTLQYIDLESRLNNQIAQEKRLVEILDMAENVEEVLEVERELYRVRGEIESMTARFNHLKDQVSYSTLYLSLKEEAIPTTDISVGAFDNIRTRVKEAFTGSVNFILHALSTLIVIMAAMLPVLVVLAPVGIIVWLIVKRALHPKNKTE